MRRQNLTAVTLDQLVDRFAEIDERQYDTREVGDIAKYNRPFSRMSEVEAELRRRSPEAQNTKRLTPTLT